MPSKREAVGSWRSRSIAGLIVAVALLVTGLSAKIACGQDVPAQYVPRDMDDLQRLVAPIALYPDALLAQVLAATTYPDDVIAAAQWEDAGNNPQGIDAQPWDPSVKGVARYPAILHYLAANGDWMNDLGASFLNQQGDVMSAVQNLRGEALAAGTLVNTPQQTVINDGGYIQIIPTNPDILYCPVYDPQIVYAPPPYAGGAAYTSYITFGPGVNVGDWLDFDLDWHDRGIYFGHWGTDRPWWHHYGTGPQPYNNFRPGLYKPGQFKDGGGHLINAPADHWTRDNHRPAPHEKTGPLPLRANPGPARGYPPQPPAHAVQPAPGARGADVARQSERGKASRQAPPAAHVAPEPVRAAPAPRAAPEPAREAPVRQEPVRSAPRPAAPPPEARPSAPVRGGAMGGYQNGAAAAQSASRGGASRGGGGGAAHGRR